MTGRERLAAVFDGHMVDRVPFALKGWRIPQCEAELRLRNGGMCILDACGVYTSASPNVRTETSTFSRDGSQYRRTVIHTPKGDLTSLFREVPTARIESTSWQVEWPFKGPRDYPALEAMVRDRRYRPSYEPFLEAQERIGREAYFKTSVPGCPLHDIMYSFMGLDTFSVEWAERRDQVIALHQAMLDNHRPILDIVAASPARLVQSGGNLAPAVLGRERFAAYVVPHWEQVCQVLHQGDKLVGCHLDADNRLWADLVGASPLDWIEAFSPAPDTDMTLAEARKAWPGKVLFINFPSAVHLDSAAAIAATTRQLLREAAPGDRFVIAITENVPENRWRESFATIQATLTEFGRLPLRPEAIP